MRRKNIDIVGLTTDEDSSTHAKCAKEVPSKERKRKIDLNHYKKSITKQLYALKKVKGFSELTPKTISYFGRSFAYCVQQNKNDEKAIKKGIGAVTMQAFGDHTACSSSWCRYLRDPSTFKHNGLPFGKPLRNLSLKGEVSQIFQAYLSDDVVARLAPCASTQVNESFSALVSTKCPNSRHCSGSSSIFHRVAAAVCQKNEGYNYLCKISRRLGITTGILKKYISIRDNKMRKDKLRKASKTFKSTWAR